jgi:hypothetical protein
MFFEQITTSGDRGGALALYRAGPRVHDRLPGRIEAGYRRSTRRSGD